MIYLDGHKILEDSDNRLNWNLLTGSSQEFKNVTIQKDHYYPGYEFEKEYDFPVTFSAFVVNKSDMDILVHMDGKGIDADSNIIKANSSCRISVSNPMTLGVFFTTVNKVKATSDIVLQVKEEKLETGLIATPWMPAISDLMFKNQNGGYDSQLSH